MTVELHPIHWRQYYTSSPQIKAICPKHSCAGEKVGKYAICLDSYRVTNYTIQIIELLVFEHSMLT